MSARNGKEKNVGMKPVLKNKLVFVKSSSGFTNSARNADILQKFREQLDHIDFLLQHSFDRYLPARFRRTIALLCNYVDYWPAT